MICGNNVTEREMMKLERGLLPLLLGCLTMGACSTEPIPEGEPVGFGEQAPPSQLKCDPQDGWVSQVPSSSMRVAQYELPDADGTGNSAEISVFAGIGGTVEQNISRWVGQFSAPDGSAVEGDISKRTVGTLTVTTVDVSGTYSSSNMGPMAAIAREPMTDTRMIGAVIEAEQGAWFVKLVGPERTVTHWEQGFETFLDSCRME
jgi:hypothetical protein